MSSPVPNKVVPVEAITEAFPLASPKPNNDSGSRETPPEISPAEQLGAPSIGGGPTTALKKRMEDEGHEERSRAFKKRRLIWTPELHCVFVDACNTLAKDTVPKEILSYMKSQGVTDLTRENVASHLQKYRLYLEKLGTSTDEFEASSNSHLKSVPLNVTKESNFKPSSSCTQNNNPSSRSSLTLHRTSSNQPMAVLPPLDQTQYSIHNMLQQPLLNHSAAVQELATTTGNGNVWDVNGVTAMGFLNPPTTANWPNMIDVGEVQENSIWSMQYPPQLPQPNPMEQAFNQAVDYSLTNNILQPQSLSNEFSSIDGHRAFPWMGYSADLYNDFDYSFFGGFDQYHHEAAMALEKLQVDDCEKKMDLPNETMKPAAFNVTDKIPRSTIETGSSKDHQTTFNPTHLQVRWNNDARTTWA